MFQHSKTANPKPQKVYTCYRHDPCCCFQQAAIHLNEKGRIATTLQDFLTDQLVMALGVLNANFDQLPW